MQQFIYQPQDVGLTEWPSGTLRLEGIPVTENPLKADVFTVPGSLDIFRHGKRLSSLPYFRGNEARHVFFDCSDHEELYGQPCLFIRCNVRQWYFAKDPHSLSWPWPVEDFSECIEPLCQPETEGPMVKGFKYDLSFQGWNWSDVRKASVKSCRVNTNIRCDIATYNDFCGYIYYEPEGIRRRLEFRRSMKESRIALCPESIPGTFPYRFYEALSAGRVPLLIGSEFVFPFADEIPYSDFLLRLEAREAWQAGECVREYLSHTCDHELIERGKLGRQYWESHLDSNKWPALMAYAVQKKVESLCASR